MSVSEDRYRPVLGITMGDPAGIGPEVAVRGLSDPEVFSVCRPLLVGDLSVIQAAVEGLMAPLDLKRVTSVSEADFRAGRIDVLDLANVSLKDLKKGTVSAAAGTAAFEYVTRACDMALSGQVDAIVTCPINKEAIRQGGYAYAGHTEILAERTGSTDFGMMLVAGGLRVVLVTIHLALEEAIRALSEERILKTIRLAHHAGLMLGSDHPRIAVPGLNPHAGEGGIFGREEIDIIEPAIRKGREMGYDVEGPFPPDTVFRRALHGEYDFVTAMYHDQGLIPIKLIGFDTAVNVTLGLPIIRTSVDHGTAFDIAWQFRANAQSLIEAIRFAVRMATAKHCKVR